MSVCGTTDDKQLNASLTQGTLLCAGFHLSPLVMGDINGHLLTRERHLLCLCTI